MYDFEKVNKASGIAVRTYVIFWTDNGRKSNYFQPILTNAIICIVQSLFSQTPEEFFEAKKYI